MIRVEIHLGHGKVEPFTISAARPIVIDEDGVGVSLREAETLLKVLTENLPALTIQLLSDSLVLKIAGNVGMKPATD